MLYFIRPGAGIYPGQARATPRAFADASKSIECFRNPFGAQTYWTQPENQLQVQSTLLMIRRLMAIMARLNALQKKHNVTALKREPGYIKHPSGRENRLVIALSLSLSPCRPRFFLVQLYQ